MYGVTQDTYIAAIATCFALPLNIQESVVDPDKKKRKRSSKIAVAQTGDQVYPSHIVKALNHLVGKAGFEVSNACAQAYYSQESVKRMQKAKADQDKIDVANDKIDYSLDRAQHWLSLRNYLADKLEQQIADEGLSQVLQPITPFEVKEAEVMASLKKSGEEKQLKKVMEIKNGDRNSIIDLIEGIEAVAYWGDDVGFISLARLVEKLDDFSDEEAERKSKWAHVDKIAQSSNVKMIAIDAVANEINNVVENAYELVIDKDDVVH